jgi:hypothetical protein
MRCSGTSFFVSSDPKNSVKETSWSPQMRSTYATLKGARASLAPSAAAVRQLSGIEALNTFSNRSNFRVQFCARRCGGVVCWDRPFGFAASLAFALVFIYLLIFFFFSFLFSVVPRAFNFELFVPDEWGSRAGSAHSLARTGLSNHYHLNGKNDQHSSMNSNAHFLSALTSTCVTTA